MQRFSWKSTIPYFSAVVLFLLLSFAYFSPVLEGKIILGHDNVSYLAASKEALDYKEKTGEHALWTNAMFGGMPTYQITGYQPSNLIKHLEAPLKLVPRPAFFSFLYLLCGFLLLKMLGLNVWLSMAGAIALTFASYNFIILAAGHNTKAIAIAYIMPLLGSIILAFRKNRWVGGVLAALFLALAIKANHLQILYYTLFIVIIFFISELIFAIKEKRIAELAKTSGVLLIAALLAIATNAGTLLTTYEYSKYTMRGDATGLTSDSSTRNGLEADYITQWSYGIGETMTLLIPNFRGGASGGALDMNSATAAKLKTMGVPERHIQEFIERLPLYWGNQPGTSGPVYIGAIVCLLFVMALFLLEARYKWWLLSAIVLSVLLSWGKNFMPFTQFFIDYVPLYNKFRAVSMTLVIAGVCMPIMGFLALKNIFEQKVEKEKILSALKWSAGITGGFCLIFAVFPSLAGNFIAPSDARQFTDDLSFLHTTLPLDRKAMLSADAWRSLAFIVLATGALYLFVIGKLKSVVVTAVLAALILVDLWGISKRYLNDDNFVERELLFNPVRATAADKFILADTDPSFRVLDLTKDLFNSDATPSYFHKNIGGYSAVKMRRFQDLIDHRIMPELAKFTAAFQTAETLEDLNEHLQQLQILNMLNMRYLIYHPDAPPVRNEFANGNAWFVKHAHVVGNADEEMAMLSRIDTKRELVAGEEFASDFPMTYNTASDSLAQIRLTHYSPNKLIYEFQSETPQMVVFSEIYYSKGWRAFVDGEETPHFRANYVLRAMLVDAGAHTIEFRFEPTSYRIGNCISLIASLLLIIALLTVVGFRFYRKSN